MGQKSDAKVTVAKYLQNLLVSGDFFIPKKMQEVLKKKKSG
jgi:hypothetical protein